MLDFGVLNVQPSLVKDTRKFKTGKCSVRQRRKVTSCHFHSSGGPCRRKKQEMRSGRDGKRCPLPEVPKAATGPGALFQVCVPSGISQVAAICSHG